MAKITKMHAKPRPDTGPALQPDAPSEELFRLGMELASGRSDDGQPISEADRFARELKRSDPRRLHKAYDDLEAALEGIILYRALDPSECRAIVGRLAEKYRMSEGLGRNSDTDSTPLSPLTPSELWEHRKGRKENPVAFLRRVYAPWLGRGMTRADLRRIDLPLYRAFSAWLRRHPEDPVAELPSLSEAIDRKIERLAHEFTPDDLRKLGLALQNRQRRKRDFD
jgi:hypothetical protein